ncbi:MAG: glycosyltransferase family 9 protein [Ignavibacteria bacterium]|nr:glycosyltransferase family 9 protein [Ignavibacteria bacterium]
MFSREPVNPIKRILVVRTDRLGDVVLSLPMLPALRHCFPDAYIAMLLRTYTGELVRGNPYVDRLIWYDDRQGLIPLREMRNVLRKERFDAVIVVYPTLRLAWLMFLAGIPIRVGTGYRYYSVLFNRRVYEHRKDARRHEVEYNLGLLSRIQCSPDAEPEFYIDIPEDTDRRVREILSGVGIAPGEPLAILHPGSGGSARDWSTRNFGVLAARLTDDDHLRVVVTGSRDEADMVASVVEDSGGRATGLAGMFGLKELAALTRGAAIFIANSTGPLHIAAAVKAPVVGLYPQHTAMSHHRWGPWCSRRRVLVPDKPVDCNDCVESNARICACMESITVDQVHAAARSLLHEGPKSNSTRVMNEW